MPHGATPDPRLQHLGATTAPALAGSAGRLGRNARRLMTITRVVGLPLAAVVLGATVMSGSLSAFTSLTDNAGNLLGAPALNPPKDVTAACGASITVDWTATVDTYATGHRLFRATAPEGPYSQIAEITPRTTSTYVDSPAPGSYYYMLRSYFQSWESVDSMIATAPTPCPAPFGAVADTYAKQDKNPDTNYGTIDEMKIKALSNKEDRSFVRFDISSIPAGTTINSATLTLCLNTVPGVTRTYDVHQVTSSWVETTLTWNLQPTVAASPTDSTTTPGAPGCMTWTVTADVQAWVDGTTNNGWRVTDSVIGGDNESGKIRTREDLVVPAEQPKLVVDYGAASSANLSGTVVASATEMDIRAGGDTLVITLVGDAWVATVGDDNAITTALINGIDSDQAEALGWDALVKAGLTFNDVTRTSDSTVTITLPAFGTFDITADETITATVPATAVIGGVALDATPTFEITTPTFGAVADTWAKQDKNPDTNYGTNIDMLIKSLADKEDRSFVRFDTSSIPAGATINSATLTLCLEQEPGATRTYDVHQITSSWVETTLTWNLQPTVVATATDSATTPGAPGCMTWTVTADVQAWVDGTTNNGWRIDDSVIGGASETGKFRTREDSAVPAEQPKLVVDYSTGPSAALSGSLVTSADETEILVAGETLIITLTNDTWDPTVGADNAITTALINGIDSAGVEAAGWDAVVKAGLTFSDVARTSDTVVTITLGAEPTYLITADETITVTVPATAVVGGDAIVATPTFDITDIAQADLSGTLVPLTVDGQIVIGGETLIITLVGDNWDATVGADNAITTALINGIDSAQAEALGWDALVKAGLTFSDVTRTSNTVVTITLPAFGTYDISADETITATVPATAVVGGAIVATPTFDILSPAEDFDAVPYLSDNCPATFNIVQYDSDGDTTGDACDSSPTVASAGTFTDSGQTLGTENSYGVEFGDVDGDGDLDAIVHNAPEGNTVWLNNGSGTFTDSGQTLGSSASYGIAVGDVDGDGDLDVMFSNGNQPDKVWLNNGSGTFTDSGQTLGTSSGQAVAFGDVDGDGDLDAASANYNNSHPNVVWLNNGSGTFTDSGEALGGNNSGHVAFADVDDDGDLDAMVASRFGQPTTLSLNNGSGVFTDSGQTLGTGDNTGVAFGDLDGDGDLDVMLSIWGAGNTVWLNNGSGTFTDSGQTLGTADSWKLTFGDIDGDGDLDAAVANRTGQADTVWLNNGSGTFTDSGQTLGTAEGYKVALGDVDGDGDLDAITANLGQANVVWLNNLAPTADVGGPYTITEGDSVMLDASASSDPDSDPLTYSWDLDDDATFGDVVGETPTVTWAQLQSFGIDDDGVYPIAVEVDDGTITDTDATTLTVDNFVPVLSTTGASSVTVSTVYTLTLGVTDPGADTMTSWTINWGDGTIDVIAGNPSSATHTYTRVGFTFDILASATDEDVTVLQNELLVASYGGQKIFRFEETTGDYLQDFATMGAAAGAVIGPDGRLYVSNYGDDTVRVYNAETGADLGVFASGGGLTGPEGLVFGPDGHLYVAGYSDNAVLRYDGTTGVFIDTFTSGTAVAGPVGVAFGPDGNLYVGSWSNHYVNRYNGSTGVFIDQFVGTASGGLDTPDQLTFGPDGNLYIASEGSVEVLRYNGSTGAFIDVFVAAGGASDQPTGVAFGPDGNLYVTDYTDAAVLRYNGTTGAYIDDYVPNGSGGLTAAWWITFLPKHQVLITP